MSEAVLHAARGIGGEAVRVAIHGGNVMRSKGAKVVLAFCFFFLPSLSRVVTSFYGCNEFDSGDGEIREYMNVGA